MTKAKTVEDYEAELEAAETELASIEPSVRTEQETQLHAALQWVNDNHHDLTPEQADQVIDLVAAFQQKNFNDALAWKTLPKYR